ncbi:MAG: phenylacetate--CoA ligase family protein [Candidatus Omnitrophica bacterium]|nr:phenylacetate--CoA ligase family protein [Candidatus Omnitrophota bacterium]
MSILTLIKNIPFVNPAAAGYFLYHRAPAPVLKKIEAENFRRTIRYAASHSRFYKRKFAEHRIDPQNVRHPEDLGDFFTTAEDLRAFNEDFVSARPDTAYETTGTTSKKSKRVYFSRSEMREAGWAGAVGLWNLGVRPEDRLVSAFDYALWVSGPVLQASCEVLKCFHIEVSRMDPAEFYERVRDYGITVIVGDPSWIVRLSEIAEKRGAWPVKLLLAGGENLTEEARRFVEGVWKADFLLSYGQTEAFGAIGMETREKEGYYLNEFHNSFEIINPDREGYGELVYTTLNRRVMPLVRYRSGDLTRFLTAPSKSGLPVRRIEKLKGRVDEWIATGIGNIAPWMFEPFFQKIRGITPDWQVVVEKDGLQDRITFHVESTGTGSVPAGLEKEILDAFEREFPSEFKVAEMGICRIAVAVHPSGVLRDGRKLKRIVENRKF